LPSLPWLRLLYAYPGEVSRRLIETMANHAQICHYLDIPLQHGHPGTLRRMGRPSDIEAVLALLDALRQAMPDVAIRSTFIVGYPGETETEFAALLDLLSEARLDNVGMFAYSAEEGTQAAELPGRVPAEVVASRYERAMTHQQELSRVANRAQVGRELDVLVEGVGDGLSVGRCYRQAPEIDGLTLVPGELSPGTMCPVRIVQADVYDLVGQILGP